MSSPWQDFGPWTDFEEKSESRVAVAPELDVPQDIERRIALREQLGYPETEPRATPWEGFKAELQERVGDPAREFLRTIVSAPLKAFGALASDQTQMEVDPYSGAIIPKQVQPPVLIPPEQQPLYKTGTAAEQFIEQTFPPPEEPELARQVAGGAGQVGAMMLGGGAARALGAGVSGTAATATALGAASEFDDAFTRARKRGDDPDTALAKSLGYATVAALIENKLGAGRILRQLMPAASAAAQRLTAMGVSKKILGNFIVQGIEEGGQRFAQNWIVEGEPSTEGVMEEAIPGAIIGGVFSLPGAAIVAPSIQEGGEPSAVQRETKEILQNVPEPTIPQEGQVQVPVSDRFKKIAETLTAGKEIGGPKQPLLSIPATHAEFSKSLIDSPSTALQSLSDAANLLIAGKPTQNIKRISTYSTMMSRVLERIHDNEILNSIIKAVPIDVMNQLTGTEFSSKPLLNQKTMLQNILSIDPSVSVSPLVMRVINSVSPLLQDRAMAILASNRAIRSSKGGIVKELTSTELASELNHVDEITKKLPPESSGKEVIEVRPQAAEARVEPTQIADELDMTFSGETPAQVPGMTPTWDFRFKRPGVDMFSVVVPSGSPKAEIIKARDAKIEQLKSFGEWKFTPSEIVEISKEVQPAVRIGGRIISSPEKGHIAMALEIGTPEAIADVSKPENQGFVYKGKFLSREATSKMLGETTPLTSERLREIQQPKGGEPIEEAQRQKEVLTTQPSQAVSETPPAVGFFPRVSETLGLGEPALPPTVETVRAQRELEASTAVPPAPGEKTTPSRGTWFSGNNPRETSQMMQDRANAFLQGKNDEQAIVDLARAAAGDPAVQLDNQAANFAIKDLLVRIHAKIQSAKENPIYQQQAWAQIDRLAEISRRLGAEDARSLVSRQLAYRQIDWMMPLLSWRGIIQDKWRNALGLQPNDSVEGLDTEENARKFNLPQLNGPEAKKLAELAQRAQQEPQGVRRNKTLEEMVKIIQSDSRISKLDLLRDSWYGSVLMRVGTMVNVLAGSYATGSSFAGLAALDRIARLHPIQAMKIIGQFIGGTIEGTLIADQIARKGAYHLLPDAEQRMVNLLTGKSGARFDNLEELLRRGNPIGVLAYTRRFMAALDYIGALGTRDSQVLYAALTRGDQESLDALEKRFDSDTNKRAHQQARAEMGPKASRAEVLVRKREILEEGVDRELKDAAVQTARRAAQNADPRGIPGWLYRVSSKLSFFARAPIGLAFMRSAMNMVQNAVDYTPVIGAVSATRGEIESRLPPTNPLRKMGIGLDIPIEERRMMWVAQATSFGIAAIAASLFLGDDEEDDGMEISGSWRGLSPQRKSQLMELGERPNSIRFGKNGPWISFKQMPWAPPLAMIGTMRDEERFHAKDWDGESAMNKIVSGWLGGLLYVRDISSLSGIAGLFDMNAWSTQEKPTELTQKASKLASQSAGRFATGYIPSILKEIDEFSDPTLYRPSKDELAGWWIRNVPYARRTVGPGPALNNFGEPIKVTPPPIKSWVGFGKDTDLYNTLGQLASRGIFLPEPGRTAKIVDDDANYREMTETEWYDFIKERGPMLKDSFNEGRLRWLRESDDREVIKWLSDTSESVSKTARLRLFPMTKIERLRREPIK